MNIGIELLNREWRSRYSLKTILDCMPELLFIPEYVWFLVHLYAGLIPKSSGQLVEIIVCIIPLE